MDKIIIEGGHQLEGSVKIGGAKNAALPIMAAAMLIDGSCEIRNVPDLQDVQTMRAVLNCLGSKTVYGNSRIMIDSRGFQDLEVPYDLVRKMRASIYVLGPLVAKHGHARVSLPGGCAIGQRAIDLHLRGLESLGARVGIEHGYVEAYSPRGGLRGGECVLRGSWGTSVGATCNTIMAAVLAKGLSILHDVAREPEVIDLVNFLNSAGAHIEGAGTDVLKIEGVDHLDGLSYSIIPDRVETGTFLAAAVATGGRVRVENCDSRYLKCELAVLREMGVNIELIGKDIILVERTGRLSPTAIRTGPWPGFATDLQAQYLSALTLATGESTITETVFPDRFIHVAELNRLGANITVAHATAIVQGVSKLTGAHVMASDLRASAALIIAGLAAEGVTECHRIYHLDRGYERLEFKLRGLGAVVVREEEESSKALESAKQSAILRRSA